MTSSENVKSEKMGINGIRSNAIRKEFKLDSMNLSLSISLVIEIFLVLSWERVSALRFFAWILTRFGSFEMTKFVMEITERKTGYYNILIKEKCRRCDFEGAKGILDEMRQMGCDPIVNTYNYLLSSLCRSDKTDKACQLLEEMQERNCLPNPLTFEIFIYHSCRLGKFDLAIEFLDRMISNGPDSRNC